MYYFIGIKGAGMSALALILNDIGYTVTGYDDESKHQFTEDKLIERGIEIYNDSSFELNLGITVVTSTAINQQSHPELKRAKEMGLKIYEYHEMLGKISKKFQTISISGCHGKTTTTTMMATTFNELLGSNYLIGDGTGFANLDNKYFILEACEYHRHFLNYESDYSIITNIELDHVDYFKDIEDVKEAYQEFAQKTEKMIIACGDDKNVRELEITKPIFYYGIKEGNDIIAREIEESEKGIKFDVYVEENFYGHFDLPIYGKHMLLNSLAVIGLGYYLRFESREILKNLKKFKGANRRFAEVIVNNDVIVDDYAHHPTEIKATINTARIKYPNKKVVAIFEPHTFSRTKQFAKEIAEALNLADYSYVLDIYYAREDKYDYEGVDSTLITDNLKKGEILDRNNHKKLLEHDNSVFIFMSPKEIADIKGNLIEELQKAC